MPMRFGFPDLQNWQPGALLIRPSQLVSYITKEHQIPYRIQLSKYVTYTHTHPPHRDLLTYLWRLLAGMAGVQGSDAAAEHDRLHPLTPLPARCQQPAGTREAGHQRLAELVAVVGRAVTRLQRHLEACCKAGWVGRRAVLPRQVVACGQTQTGGVGLGFLWGYYL